MRRTALFALAAALFGFAAGSPAQPPTKSDDAPLALKGFLPQNWKTLGLTDEQKQKVYGVQNRYNEQIDRLEQQIKELKAKMTAERMEVLTAEQKKRLGELLNSKAGVK